MKIDSIVIKPREDNMGRNFTTVRVWIAGIPFSADLIGETMERQINRIAAEEGVEILDLRNVEN